MWHKNENTFAWNGIIIGYEWDKKFMRSEWDKIEIRMKIRMELE